MANRTLIENWHTGEARLWLLNDEPLYLLARRCKRASNPYRSFLRRVGDDMVPGNTFRWSDKRIQRTLMNETLRTLDD